MLNTLLTALTGVLLLAACAEVPHARSPGSVADATIGGDGSPILLSPLLQADLQGARLAGELGCSFAVPGSPPLLLAMGDVASAPPARGVVKVGNSVEQVVARAPGGYDAMLKNGTFVGRGKMVTVALRGGRPVGSGESPSYPAVLTFDRADGAKRTIAGLWTCGP